MYQAAPPTERPTHKYIPNALQKYGDMKLNRNHISFQLMKLFGAMAKGKEAIISFQEA